jgi:hypothetical protein
VLFPDGLKVDFYAETFPDAVKSPGPCEARGNLVVVAIAMLSKAGRCANVGIARVLGCEWLGPREMNLDTEALWWCGCRVGQARRIERNEGAEPWNRIDEGVPKNNSSCTTVGNLYFSAPDDGYRKAIGTKDLQLHNYPHCREYLQRFLSI